MAEPDVVLKGILERNAAAESSPYRLNHATIEVDVSEVEALGEDLEGQPVNVEGHFEVQEHPGSDIRWVFKVHSLRADTFSGRGGSHSGPPPAPGG